MMVAVVVVDQSLYVCKRHLLRPWWSLNPSHWIACPLVTPKYQTFHQQRIEDHQTCPKSFEKERNLLHHVSVLLHQWVEHHFSPKSHHALYDNQRMQSLQCLLERISWLEHKVQNQEGCWSVEERGWLGVDMAMEHWITMPYACDIELSVPNQFVGLYEKPT